MFVRIVPLMFQNSALIDAVSEIVRQRFNLPVIVPDGTFDLDGGYDYHRNQVSSNWILRKLLMQYPANQCRVLALTNRDLYSPVLTYVFGEAELGGRVAVVSIHRFQNELYGLSANADLVKSRLIREVVHELGHTHGLIHCHNQECVMYPSSYVEEIDMKPDSFCESCHQKLFMLGPKASLSTRE